MDDFDNKVVYIEGKRHRLRLEKSSGWEGVYNLCRYDKYIRMSVGVPVRIHDNQDGTVLIEKIRNIATIAKPKFEVLDSLLATFKKVK